MVLRFHRRSCTKTRRFVEPVVSGGEQKETPSKLAPCHSRGLVSELIKERRRSLCHDPEFDAKFLAGLGEVDAAYAKQIHEAGCVHCEGALDCAYFRRKPRGELGEAAGAYERRASFCCRRQGCRRRATPLSLRFLGRKVYIAVVVVLASAAARATRLSGRGSARQVHGVPARTVRRWHGWWQTVFALGAFWSEAKAFFATPVEVGQLPASLLERFGEPGPTALERMLRFTAPITTESVSTRIAMVV